MMHDIIFYVGAFVLIVVLCTLGSIHRELRETLTFFKSMIISIKTDTRYLTDKSKVLENKLEELGDKLSKIPPEDIKWQG